ncbi:MAG: cytochrome b/b6 domain-containing protein [Solirubrobacteraceae bacterium]
MSALTRTERVLHWANAGAFFALLATGMALYLPSLAAHLANRPVIKALHLAAAVAWLLALGLVAALGDRQALLNTRREIERFDRDDALWLRRRRAPQGRFNAGQKVHVIVQAGFLVLFFVSGTLLLLGERNTSLRLPSTIVLHDALTYVGVLLVVGHIYLAMVDRATRPALRGMLRGTVDSDWALLHHPKWDASEPGRRTRRRPEPKDLALAAVLIAASVGGGAALVNSVVDGGSAPRGASLSPR